MRILFVGDVFGKPGVEALKRLLPGLLRSERADFCIVNGENAEQGKGLLPAAVEELFQAGADVITGGNHSLYREKVHDLFDREPRLLRPLNFPEGTPGRGSGVYDARAGKRIAVLNLHGRALLPPSDDPFRLGKAAVEELRTETPLLIVDFHAEATAEKIAFARYVDGLATAVIGTHTHVQTADEAVSAGGTAYITDAGMTGPEDSCIGMKPEQVIKRFVLQTAARFEPSARGPMLNAAVIGVDDDTGRARSISRIYERLTLQ